MRKKQESESSIQAKLIRALTLEGWYCRKTHGNVHQAGFPDWYACSKRYGTRWIEVKRPTTGRFTQAQLGVFTRFASKNIGVWVLTGYERHDVAKLFGPSNWYTYLKGGITIPPDAPRIPKRGPEGEIQNEIMAALSSACACQQPCMKHRFNNWFCLETYGSAYQAGFPDVYCCHKSFGSRWIECKNPTGYKFTPAQTDVFPRLSAEGVPIHVLTGSSDHELQKIFGPSNWYTYLGGYK